MIAMNSLISNTNWEKFSLDLTTAIHDMQEKGLNVEVQYQPLIMHTNQLCYTALVLGRLKGE